MYQFDSETFPLYIGTEVLEPSDDEVITINYFVISRENETFIVSEQNTLRVNDEGITDLKSRWIEETFTVGFLKEIVLKEIDSRIRMNS